jgi:two-component system, OmpR family, phosphate regulon sensor histidine kinase PhoR
MVINPRWLAWLIAICVATITIAFLSLITRDSTVLFVTFAISASATFILVYFTIEFIVLREVNEVYSALSKLKKKDFTIKPKNNNPTLSPIQQLNDELYAYTSGKQQEIDQLKKLEIYRREFLADVSHELKTPIFVAQGYIETLLDGALEDADVSEKFLRKASVTLDGLNNLVQDLVTLSQMEAGMITMSPSIFNLCGLLGELSDIFEKRLQERNMKLFIHNNTSKCEIEADRPRIRQVFFNLIDNAIKYSYASGEIHIKLENNPKGIHVEVRDNGQGIPPEDIEHIFERFYRVEKSRTKTEGGSGLGLAIVKQILEAHRANIAVKSKLGEKTTFSFDLPAQTS